MKSVYQISIEINRLYSSGRILRQTYYICGDIFELTNDSKKFKLFLKKRREVYADLGNSPNNPVATQITREIELIFNEVLKE